MFEYRRMTMCLLNQLQSKIWKTWVPPLTKLRAGWQYLIKGRESAVRGLRVRTTPRLSRLSPGGTVWGRRPLWELQGLVDQVLHALISFEKTSLVLSKKDILKGESCFIYKQIGCF